MTALSCFNIGWSNPRPSFPSPRHISIWLPPGLAVLYVNVFLCDFYLFIFFKFYFIFKLYIIVLVLPNIKMNPPQAYIGCLSVFFKSSIFCVIYSQVRRLLISQGLEITYVVRVLIACTCLLSCLVKNPNMKKYKGIWCTIISYFLWYRNTNYPFKFRLNIKIFHIQYGLALF